MLRHKAPRKTINSRGNNESPMKGKTGVSSVSKSHKSSDKSHSFSRSTVPTSLFWSFFIQGGSRKLENQLESTQTNCIKLVTALSSFQFHTRYHWIKCRRVMLCVSRSQVYGYLVFPADVQRYYLHVLKNRQQWQKVNKKTSTVFIVFHPSYVMGTHFCYTL